MNVSLPAVPTFVKNTLQQQTGHSPAIFPYVDKNLWKMESAGSNLRFRLFRQLI